MKKIYKTLLLCLGMLFSLTLSLQAQTNLAPSATATCNTTSGGTTSGGGWNWNQINNGTISNCGNQEAFIWTQSPPASTDYMNWEWTSAKSISKIIFYNALTSNPGRTMTGCTVQYWNGSAFVTWYTTSSSQIGQQCVDSISFPTITTTQIRITDVKMVTTGQNSNPNWREIQIISGASVNNDAGVASMGALDFCSNTQALSARVFNYGKKTLDSVRLHWSINGTPQTSKYITSKLKGGKDTVIPLNAAYNLTNNTTYNFKLWTSFPNGTVDSVAANDTLKYTLKFFGNPPAPTTTSFIQCGIGRPRLSATTGVSTDTIMWYRTPTGGSPFGMGATITGPSISATTTFYAQAIRFAAKSSFNNGLSGYIVVSFNYSAYNGNYFDMTPTSPINIDSMAFRIYNFTSTTNYLLYYKAGSYNGFETNSSAWTAVNGGGGRVYSAGGQNFIKVSAKGLLINPGQSYGFYFTIDPSTGGGNDIYMQGGVNRGNADLNITGGKYSYGLFGSAQFGPNYTIDCIVDYSKACINTARTPLVVTVKPRPIGADVVKGAPFNGQFRVGDMTTPDIAVLGKAVTYELSPPTGYSNADQGSTWVINNVVAKTKFGAIVPSTDYTVVAPSSAGNGSITYAPTATYLDSFITFSVNFSDLGPHFCDSTVKRTLVVAPTPFVNFKFPSSICLGDAILFDNISTVSSGNASYIWYFGDGDTSDLQSPVHEYLSPGVYQVKLIAKSTPWNVLHDTTIQVEVGELPEAKFRANNKCQGIAVSFQNQTTVGNGALTYDWDFGDNTPNSTATNPTHNYANPGGYKVTLKASANGCVATITKNAYSFARPVANFAAPLAPVCAKSDILMPNTSTIALGNQGAYWVFGDGGSSTQFDGNHAYAASGTYAVKLLAVSEFDCKDSITKNVVIKATPNPAFSGNQFCGRIPTIFTNSTFEELPSPVYNWSFSDGVTSTLKNVTKNWPREGPFSATLKASYSNGCSASLSKDFEVLIQPKADFNVQDICSGESAAFVNLSKGDKGGIQYSWDFGNGTYSTQQAPIRLYTPTATTTYTVALVASYPGACSDTIRKTITVSESPVSNFTSKDLGLLKVSFTPSNTTYSKYEWLFGEGGSSNSVSPTYQYTYTGNFNVTLKTTNAAGCSNSIMKKAVATTSINNVANNNGISIYPNPNAGGFTVSNAAGNAMKVEIYNVLGEKVYTKTTTEGSLAVDLDNNAKGIYLVKVTINGVTSTSKITVTN